MANDSPTLRQLAYLDELKMRLGNLRARNMAVVAQTAEILQAMSSPRLDDPNIDVPAAAVVVAAAAVASPTALKETNSVKKNELANGNKIKELVQRFEDLRKTSEQLTDLPMPQELIGVDVRRLLTRYEKRLEDGNVLQQSWYLLKKSTESCARHTRKEEFTSTSQINLSSGSVRTVSNRNASAVAVGNAKAQIKEQMSKNSVDISNWSYSTKKYGKS